jgi:hypothetical protein
MPIDIALGAETPTATLALREAQPLPDGSGFAAFLVVRSGAFAAAMPFFFTEAARDALIAGLDHLVAGRSGTARLDARDTADSLTLTAGADGGAVSISGTLHDPDSDQLLRFRFPAPRPAVTPLVAGLRRLTIPSHR